MPATFSLESLSLRINEWCRGHGVVPANGQVGDEVSERNVRYYRTLGLLDAPVEGAYTEKHLLQLTGIRLLQARGLPLRRIRELLHGRSEFQLRELRERGLREAKGATEAWPPSNGPEEVWRSIPISEDFMLISRRGTPLTLEQRQAVAAALGVSGFK